MLHPLFLLRRLSLFSRGAFFMKNISTKRLVQTALFISLALAMRQLSIMLPFGGSGGMRIGISEVFTKMPALLFGPFWGGAASGLVDFLAQMIKSEGAYLWPMLAVMILGGVITGTMWKVLKKLPFERLRLGLTVFSSDIVVTTLNTFILRHYYSGLAKIPFWTYYIPRVVQDLITSVLFAYILSFLLKIYRTAVEKE